jgi:Amt family ammonium transporter
MQAGFQFLEAGQVRKKHQRNAVTKSYIGICMSAIFFYLIGYGIGFGDINGKFAGHEMFGA